MIKPVEMPNAKIHLDLFRACVQMDILTITILKFVFNPHLEVDVGKLGALLAVTLLDLQDLIVNVLEVIRYILSIRYGLN